MDNDSANIARWFGWHDLTAPMDIQAALEAAGGEDVTILVNSPGGDLFSGAEIRSMLRRYAGRTTALFQGYGASAATLAARGPAVLPQPVWQRRGGLEGHGRGFQKPEKRPGQYS